MIIVETTTKFSNMNVVLNSLTTNKHLLAQTFDTLFSFRFQFSPHGCANVYLEALHTICKE